MSSPRLTIGNQTAFTAAWPTLPWEFALAQGFDAFEWYNDKRHGWGWSQDDVTGDERRRLAELGRRHGQAYSVHARCQANAAHAEGAAEIARSIDFARDVGARLVNVYYHGDRGVDGFAAGLLPLVRYAREAGVRISVENTVFTTPADFNRLFERLGREPGVVGVAVGLCFDMGHANLCSATRNDYLAFFDALGDHVPLVHVHAHENRGDGDSHLALFTGPAGDDDAGVRGLLARLRAREYAGAIILEQWPTPPELLVQARNRLLYLWGEV